jgi:heptosyltransferase-1
MASVSQIPSRVLVIRLGAIGDVVNALVFASALKEHAPRTHLAWVVHDLARPLVEGHPLVDRVHVWSRASGLSGLARLVRELKRERYELAVDLQRIAKSALLARFSGAPRVLGFDRRRAKELSWLWTRERIRPGDPGAHMIEQYLEVARHLEIPRPRTLHRWPVDPAAASFAEGLLAELGAAPIVINIGASKPANRWEPARFGALAAALARELCVPVCLTGGPDDLAAARAAIDAAGAAGGIRDLVGKTSLRELAELCGRARLFIGCDTGPMHLAAARGAPVIALFGPSDPRRTGPHDAGVAGHVVLRTPPACAPCGRRTCNQPRHACLLDLGVGLVLEAAIRRMAPS